MLTHEHEWQVSDHEHVNLNEYFKNIFGHINKIFLKYTSSHQGNI